MSVKGGPSLWTRLALFADFVGSETVLRVESDLLTESYNFLLARTSNIKNVRFRAARATTISLNRFYPVHPIAEVLERVSLAALCTGGR